MKISIITLSFNQDKYLEESINSILNQSYSNWELIIIDPGSTDLSREIAQKYSNLDSRISLVFEKDDGPSDGLNKGFRRASGDIIGYLNSDDYYNQGTFTEVVHAFAKYEKVDCIYSHGMIEKSGKQRFQSSDKFSIRRYFSSRGLVIQQSTFFRKAGLIQNSVLFNPKNKTSWDGEFLVDLASVGGEFRKVRGNWGVFRIHDESITGSQRLKNQTQIDHSRILDLQVSKGLKFSILDKLLKQARIYSVYRRIRNHNIFIVWLLISRFKRLQNGGQGCNQQSHPGIG
ncbi:MAG: hypothetical protein RLZZ44_811 [Bacteroidota bacterium]|jgi:glycosyltransferase involved in cell wall biosynthesis